MEFLKSIEENSANIYDILGEANTDVDSFNLCNFGHNQNDFTLSINAVDSCLTLSNLSDSGSRSIANSPNSAMSNQPENIQFSILNNQSMNKASPLINHDFVLNESNYEMDTKTVNDTDLSSIFNLTTMEDVQLDDLTKVKKVFTHSDNESDSGICSSGVSCKSENSSKNTNNSSALSIFDDSSQSGVHAYSSAPSSVIELDNNQDLVDQIINSNEIDFNRFDVCTTTSGSSNPVSLSNSSNDNVQPDTASTEQLLDNIEAMLKSMEYSNLTPSFNQQNNKNNSNESNKPAKIQKIMKKEPDENLNTGSFKKISPKILPKIVPKTSTVTPINQSVTINNSSNKELVRLPINNSINKTVIIQPMTSLNDSIINAVHLDNGNTILIENLNTTNSSTLNDDSSPKAKRIKNDYEPEIILQNCPSTENSSPNTGLILSPMISNLASPSVNSNNDNLVLQNNIDPNLAKKQSRMIKNRESACLSRKRKKEYMQTLEESLKQVKDQNENLKKENLSLKEKVLVLETENNLLKEQQKSGVQHHHHHAVKVMGLHGQKPEFKSVSLNNSTLNKANTGSLKRSVVMMAVFFVFGLNMFQFINVNSTGRLNLLNSSNNLARKSRVNDDKKKIGYTPAQLAASLAMANARDGALLDLHNPVPSHIKSRHLLSDYDYPDMDEKDNIEIKRKNISSMNGANITNNTNMELILINGTWHMVDLDICYKYMTVNSNETDKFYNHTHFSRINNELNDWFERHVRAMRNSSGQNGSLENFASALWREFMKEKHKEVKTIPSKGQASRFKSIQNRRQARIEKKDAGKTNTANTEVSLYDNQSRLYEKFARTVRTRDDTFYYVSFRRDHIIFPALNQNKTQRPKVSLIFPASMHNSKSVNESSTNSADRIQFMQIDCEVVDTKLFTLNTVDIPQDYMRILDKEAFLNNQKNF